VPVSKTGEGQSGMRTERVVLEITRPAIANHPAPADQFMWQRGWLTEEEREMIGIARNHFAWKSLQQLVDACDKLLARSSPPEVVLPPFKGELTGGFWAVAGYNSAILMCRASLAAAGVAVKEVGK